MGKSKRQESRFWRFAYYKNSGLIVFVPIIAAAIIGGVYLYSSQEFFSPWSCETINEYHNNVNIPTNILPHDLLDKSQHDKLHYIIDECKANVKFLPP